MTLPQAANLDDVRRAVADALRRHWLLYLIEGIVLIILGALAIIVPPLATLAVTIFVGWLIFISGVMGLITTFWMRGAAPGFWWSLISALLAIIVGLLLIGRPVSGAISLTLALIVFFIIEGVVSIMYALDHRHDLPRSWVWMLMSGIVDLVLSALILAGLPGTAAWALGILVGVNMIMGGVSMAAMALHARRLTAL